MGTSYPDKTNFTGVWKLSDIYKNKISDGTYPRGSTRGIMGGGGTPSNTNVIDFITIETTGDATDFGDLGAARYCGTAVSNSTRQIFMGGYESDYVTTMEYIHHASTGNAADFGDSTQARGTGSEGNAGNTTRGIHAGGIKSGPVARVDTIDFVTIASLGNATDFGNLGAIRSAMATNSNTTRSVFSGGASSGPSNQIDTIEFIEIASTGNAVDFGDLSNARDRAGGAASTTRGLVAGGHHPSGNYSQIESIQLATLGNGVDFGDLTRTSWTMACMSNITRGVWGAGDPTTNVIDFLEIESAGTATDFGDATVARFNNRGSSNGHAGIEADFPRAPELYSPTGRPVRFGGVGVGDIGLFQSGGYGYVKTIDFVKISSTGNGVDFGDTAVAGSHMGGAGSSTRAFVAGYSGPIVNNIDYGLFSTKGNHADFGNLTVARDKIGSLSNNTRACFLGGRGQTSSPESLQNVIDYITMATIGNASDFGDLAAATQVGMGVANNTRGVLGGGKTPSHINVIQYITIGSTGNAQDFGDLSVTRGPGGGTGVSSTTRGVFAGGEAPGANSDVMDYITIASTGNATDFGDLQFVTNFASGLSNNTRGVFSGFNNTGAPGADSTFGNCPQISYITIASTGNYTNFGDLTARRYGLAAASNAHGALS